jgi:hypothetical protein
MSMITDPICMITSTSLSAQFPLPSSTPQHWYLKDVSTLLL